LPETSNSNRFVDRGADQGPSERPIHVNDVTIWRILVARESDRPPIASLRIEKGDGHVRPHDLGLCLLKMKAGLVHRQALRREILRANAGQDLLAPCDRGRLYRCAGVLASELDCSTASFGGGERASIAATMRAGRRAHLCQSIGTCYLQGEDVGKAMVRQGLARDCPRFSGGRYDEAEVQAAAHGATMSTECRATVVGRRFRHGRHERVIQAAPNAPKKGT
jgi:hypothetical protein